MHKLDKQKTTPAWKPLPRIRADNVTVDKNTHGQNTLDIKMDITINENSVFLDNKAIYTSDFKILAFLNIGTLIILVLDLKDTDNFNQNTICIDLNGNHIWTIENKEYHQKNCPANNIYVENGKYLIYRWCGIEEEFDIMTGKILRGLLVK